MTKLYTTLCAAVRDWVLVPLTLSVVLMMVLRQYITKVGDLEAITDALAWARACWHRSTSSCLYFCRC